MGFQSLGSFSYANRCQGFPQKLFKEVYFLTLQFIVACNYALGHYDPINGFVTVRAMWSYVKGATRNESHCQVLYSIQYTLDWSGLFYLVHGRLDSYACTFAIFWNIYLRYALIIIGNCSNNKRRHDDSLDRVVETIWNKSYHGWLVLNGLNIPRKSPPSSRTSGQQKCSKGNGFTQLSPFHAIAYLNVTLEEPQGFRIGHFLDML